MPPVYTASNQRLLGGGSHHRASPFGNDYTKTFDVEKRRLLIDQVLPLKWNR